MVFFKLLQTFSFPTVFLFLILLSGLLLSKRKAGMVLLIVGTAFYLFFSVTPSADLLIRPLENRYEEQDAQEAEYIVLLTGGMENSKTALGESTIFRVVKAFQLYSNFSDKPYIIVSGDDPTLSFSSASEIAGFLGSLGVEEERIIVESESKTTFQSAKEVKDIVREKKFALVTSAYHMPRAVYSFEKYGLQPFPVPSDFKAEKDYSIFDFFPQADNLRKCNLAFHEYLGLIYYSFKKP